MGLIDAIMERTSIYRAWQAPFSEQKFAPIRKHNQLGDVRRVLDVGCGPGTNTHHFEGKDYLGIDINPSYVTSARRRHGREFVVADARSYEVAPSERFDFVLVNSFLHHIDTEHVDTILSQISQVLTPDGYVHVLELVLPKERSAARQLALWDRGDYPRPTGEWKRLIDAHFEPVVVEPFPLTVAGVTLWNMVYLKGRRPRADVAPRP